MFQYAASYQDNMFRTRQVGKDKVGHEGRYKSLSNAYQAVARRFQGSLKACWSMWRLQLPELISHVGQEREQPSVDEVTRQEEDMGVREVRPHQPAKPAHQVVDTNCVCT